MGAFRKKQRPVFLTNIMSDIYYWVVQRLISWVKNNKLTSILILVVVYFLGKSLFGTSLTKNSSGVFMGSLESASAPMALKSGVSGIGILPQNDFAPSDSTNRLVVQESNMSLVVKDVRSSVDKITEYAKSAGGFMVNSSLSQPEEAPYANISVRVPSKSLKASLDYFRSLSIKVSSENLYGTDVTDEYTDIDARLATLNKTKVKFEEILNQASKVQDILEVQRELISIQTQIDSLKGRQLYLEKTAEMARITMYLSTDEFALPYAPAETFRPAVIFKTAVRSLVGLARGLASFAIWIVVYAIIWVPALIIILFLRKRFRKQTPVK